MTTFRESRLDELPPYLAGDEGEALATVLGQAQDDELPKLRAAIVADMPHLCPDDALDGCGQWVQLERYAGDTDASYRERLKIAFQTWRKAGSAVAIEEQIAAAFQCDVRVWPIWELDFGPDPAAAYSEFWLVIGPELGTFTHDADQVRMLKRLVLKWKAAHGYPVSILVFEGSGGAILGWGEIGGTMPLTLGACTLGGATVTEYRVGKTLNGTMSALGDAGCILGGFDLT